MKTEVVENFPEYMVYYAVYGEPGYDVTDEDIQLFEEWRERNGYGWCYGLDSDENEYVEKSFDSHPAFGLPCDTVPVVFEKIQSSRRPVKSSKTVTYDVSVRPWGGMTVERLKDLGFKDANSNSYDNVAFTYTTDEPSSVAYKKLRKLIEDDNELGSIVMFEEQIIKNSRKAIKSSTGNIHCVYVSDIPVSSWNKELALSAIKNNVTNYGYYEYNGRKGCCIVGDFDDIYNFIESNGYTVDEDYIYHWKEFNWDSAKKLDKQYTGQDYFDRQIKSSIYDIQHCSFCSSGDNVNTVEYFLKKYGFEDIDYSCDILDIDPLEEVCEDCFKSWLPELNNRTYSEYEDVSGIDTRTGEPFGRIGSSRHIKSSRKISSAVDGGWEVDSSDVPEALDLFVEYYGEDYALESIAKAMSSDTLEENIDWIARQWGFGEELEDYNDAWDKYEYAKEVMGISELFNNLTQAAGYDELAEDLAFIFRMEDFSPWDKYDNDDEDGDEVSDEEMYSDIDWRMDSDLSSNLTYCDIEDPTQFILDKYLAKGGEFYPKDKYSDAMISDKDIFDEVVNYWKDISAQYVEYWENDDDPKDFKDWLAEHYPSEKITSSRKPVKSSIYDLPDLPEDFHGEQFVIGRSEDNRCKIWKNLSKRCVFVTVSGIPKGSVTFGDHNYDNKIMQWVNDYDINLEYSTGFPSQEIKSARYIATDPSTGEVLGSADTYEEAVNEWGEDVTITDSEVSKGEENMETGLFSSKKSETTKQTITRLLSSVISGEMTEDEAAEEIAQANDVNIGYAKQIFSEYMNDKERYLTSGMLEIGEALNVDFDPDGNLDTWFVDFAGEEDKPSVTLGGELVKAAKLIIRAFRDDGEKIGWGYAMETLNPAARFIIDNTDFGGNDELKSMIEGDVPDDNGYEKWVNNFEEDFANYLRDHSELFEKLNHTSFTDAATESDEYTSVDEFFVEDDEGNQYWFQSDSNGWSCVDISYDTTPEYNEGDVITAEDYIFDNIDFNEEFGEFMEAPFEYSWEDGDGESVRISNVRLMNGLYEIDDYISNDELMELVNGTVYDRDGNQLKARDIF